MHVLHFALSSLHPPLLFFMFITFFCPALLASTLAFHIHIQLNAFISVHLILLI